MVSKPRSEEASIAGSRILEGYAAEKAVRLALSEVLSHPDTAILAQANIPSQAAMQLFSD